MKTSEELLKKIDSYQTQYNISDTAISISATDGRDHRVVKKLREGKTITLETYDSLNNYLNRAIHDIATPNHQAENGC